MVAGMNAASEPVIEIGIVVDVDGSSKRVRIEPTVGVEVLTVVPGSG
jgi:hypothetical protein